jgi:hypothetical protein
MVSRSYNLTTPPLHFALHFGRFTLYFFAFNPIMHNISKKITTFVIAKVDPKEKSLSVGYDLCPMKRYIK